MSETYVECLIKGKPNQKAKALRVLFVVLAIAAFVAMFFTGWYALIIAVFVFAGGVFISGQYTDVEYEYLYIDKEIVIDRIYNQSKRKRVATYSFEKIEVIAPIKSYHLSNFGKVSDNPKDYSIGFEDKPDLRYIMFYEGKEQVLFSPNEELIKAMKNAAPRKVFTD